MSIVKKLDTIGRLVIPNEYRQALNLKKDGAVSLTLKGDSIVISSAKEPIVSRVKSKILTYREQLKNLTKGSKEELIVSSLITELEDLLD